MEEMKSLTLNSKTYDSFCDQGARGDIEKMKSNHAMRIIADVTLEEDSHYVTISEDTNGNPFELIEFVTYVEPIRHNKETDETVDGFYVRVSVNEEASAWDKAIIAPNAETVSLFAHAYIFKDRIYAESRYNNKFEQITKKRNDAKVNLICFNTGYGVNTDYAPGTRIIVWGRDA